VLVPGEFPSLALQPIEFTDALRHSAELSWRHGSALWGEPPNPTLTVLQGSDFLEVRSNPSEFVLELGSWSVSVRYRAKLIG
jgi:hypothetical protein